MQKESSMTGTKAVGKEAASHRVSLTFPPPHGQETVANVKLFGFPCQYCGKRFGRHSLHLHQKKCRDHVSELCTGDSKQESNRQIPRADVCVEKPAMRQSVETEAPSSRGVHVMLNLPPRPQTRTLQHSMLVEKGYNLPSVEDTSNTNGSYRLKFPCEICGELIISEKAAPHQRTCRRVPRSATKGEISFPVLTLRSRTRESSSRNGAKATHDLPNPAPHSNKVVRHPPTVVCYICGREYGSKSISIHEPQCLKKFESENRKLPVSERKPLPPKTINHAALVVTVTSQERMIPLSRPACIYKNELLQDTTDQYFQYCYSEWEKDLIPCKTCGRKFAPERHVKHAYRCKAKPLPNK